MTDQELMLLAIEEAKKSTPEDNKRRPFVGAVIAKDGKVLAKAFRNENGKGSHAEFLALEKMREAGKSAEGCTVYTTLEPCLKRKAKHAVPCAMRLVDAKVARVVYGIIDPHKTVQSKGLLKLRSNQIQVESFPAEFGERIEELNADFLRAFAHGEATNNYIEQNHQRPLDEWYRSINRIYWPQNSGREPAEIFCHLVEVIGAVSFLGTGKDSRSENATSFIAKAVAWWLALCGRLKVRSVEQMIWSKFPGVCPYCKRAPHSEECRSHGGEPEWEDLLNIGSGKERPKSIGRWQAMFAEIYPASVELPQNQLYSRLIEELGELAEAVRAFESVPGLFLNEAPDVFAWIMQIQNALSLGETHPFEALERVICKKYPDLCPTCAAEVCECPSVLPSTIGRTGGAISPARVVVAGGFQSAFMTVDESAQLFAL